MLLIEKVLILHSSEIFRNTPETELIELAGILEEIYVEKDHTLFVKGDVGNCMYFIYKGKVRIHHGNHTLAVLGAFAIMRMFGVSYEVDQVFIAAMLTIIGYSINDTVIVFDRIRENLSEKPSADVAHVFNTAINNVMTRTLITSFTTLIVVIVLFLFGGEVLRGFSFALIMGIVIGTYSSIYIATPIVIDLGRKVKAGTPKTAKA